MSEDIEKNEILISIKGHNSAENFGKINVLVTILHTQIASKSANLFSSY